MLSHFRRERFLVITLPAVETSARELLKMQEWKVHASPWHPTKGKDAQHTCREDSLVLEKGVWYLDLPVSDLCAWKFERIHSSSGGGHDQEIIDIFDWNADVTWRICILELINHGNDHTVQRHPRVIMVIRRMGLADFDFLGMSHVLERGVPHPKVFACLSTGNSGWLPAAACGTQVVVPGAWVFATNESKKEIGTKMIGLFSKDSFWKGSLIDTPKKESSSYVGSFLCSNLFLRSEISVYWHLFIHFQC